MLRQVLLIAVAGFAIVLGGVRAYADCSNPTTGYGYVGSINDTIVGGSCGFLGEATCYYTPCQATGEGTCLNNGQPSTCCNYFQMYCSCDNCV